LGYYLRSFCFPLNKIQINKVGGTMCNVKLNLTLVMLGICSCCRFKKRMAIKCASHCKIIILVILCMVRKWRFDPRSSPRGTKKKYWCLDIWGERELCFGSNRVRSSVHLCGRSGPNACHLPTLASSGLDSLPIHAYDFEDMTRFNNSDSLLMPKYYV
jgi:hypothetical protein